MKSKKPLSSRARSTAPKRRAPASTWEPLEGLSSLHPPFDQWVSRAKWNFEHGYTHPPTLWMLSHLSHLVQENQRCRRYELAKRLFDIAGSLILLIALSPLLVLVTIAVSIDNRGPFLFRQLRAGRFGVPFWIFKFRTMRHAVDVFLPPLAKPHHSLNLVSSAGRFIRNHKLDELPQLWNVLRGDMSFVGPRPLSVNDSCAVSEEEFLRFAVRPGLTGLWQVTVDNAASRDVKVKLDNEYVQRRSLAFDLKLLLRTPLVLIHGETKHAEKINRRSSPAGHSEPPSPTPTKRAA